MYVVVIVGISFIMVMLYVVHRISSGHKVLNTSLPTSSPLLSGGNISHQPTHAYLSQILHHKDEQYVVVYIPGSSNTFPRLYDTNIEVNLLLELYNKYNCSVCVYNRRLFNNIELGWNFINEWSDKKYDFIHNLDDYFQEEFSIFNHLLTTEFTQNHRFIIIGHSYGANWSKYFTHRLGDRCAKGVSLDGCNMYLMFPIAIKRNIARNPEFEKYKDWSLDDIIDNVRYEEDNYYFDNIPMVPTYCPEYIYKHTQYADKFNLDNFIIIAFNANDKLDENQYVYHLDKRSPYKHTYILEMQTYSHSKFKFKECAEAICQLLSKTK